jgi:hypothetical protein
MEETRLDLLFKVILLLRSFPEGLTINQMSHKLKVRVSRLTGLMSYYRPLFQGEDVPSSNALKYCFRPELNKTLVRNEYSLIKSVMTNLKKD